MILFLIFIFLIVFSILIVLLFLLNKIIFKKGYKNLGILFLTLLFSFLTYNIYIAIFPLNSFYEDEFKKVTLTDMPKSAMIVKSSSSYPDFHGDYCSSSQIRLSKNDYNKLLKDIENDTKILKTNEFYHFNEFDYTIGKKEQKNIIHSFTRKIDNKPDHFLYIGFYNDNKTIFVNVCVT